MNNTLAISLSCFNDLAQYDETQSLRDKSVFNG